MSVKTADEYKAAARDKSPLKMSFDPVGANPAQAPEESLDPVVAAARKFLQGFANLNNAEGVRNTLYDAGYSGSVSSVILGSSAPNYDTGMGGSAGKQDEKKKQEEWDRLFRLQQQLAQRLQEIDWEIEKIDGEISEAKGCISKNKQELNDVREMRSVIADHMSGKNQLELNEDGTLKNKKLEEKLREFEKQHGKIDRNNPDALKDALNFVDSELYKREIELEEDNTHQNKIITEREHRKNELTKEREITEEKSIELSRDMEAITNGKKSAASVIEIMEQKSAQLKDFKSPNDAESLDELNKIAITTAPWSNIEANISAAAKIDAEDKGISDAFKAAHGSGGQPVKEEIENSLKENLKGAKYTV
ncbi:MAG: hypothetical protein WBK55_00035 [Alphaproteobacteria bacterium]